METLTLILIVTVVVVMVAAVVVLVVLVALVVEVGIRLVSKVIAVALLGRYPTAAGSTSPGVGRRFIFSATRSCCSSTAGCQFLSKHTTTTAVRRCRRLPRHRGAAPRRTPRRTGGALGARLEDT